MFRRLTIAPFEVAIAALLVISGFTSIMHFGIIDPVSALLPAWEGAILNLVSILSGLLMLLGLMTGRGNVERSGLYFLMAVIVSRFLLFGHFFHYGENFIQTGIFDLTIIWAAVARIITTLKKQVLVRFDKDVFDRAD